MKELKEEHLSDQEWWEGLKTPGPERNKKRYSRKNKHKNKPPDKGGFFVSHHLQL